MRRALNQKHSGPIPLKPSRLSWKTLASKRSYNSLLCKEPCFKRRDERVRGESERTTNIGHDFRKSGPESLCCRGLTGQSPARTLGFEALCNGVKNSACSECKIPTVCKGLQWKYLGKDCVQKLLRLKVFSVDAFVLHNFFVLRQAADLSVERFRCVKTP